MGATTHIWKWKRRLLAFSCSLCLSCAAGPALAAIRVACVGDSITYGALIDFRERYSYPAQLQQMLGDGYEVKNFGAPGYAVQHDSALSYWNQPLMAESAEFEPDIVLFMLGTNDANDQNWYNARVFLHDYREMIQWYRDLPSAPAVYLLSPPPYFLEASSDSQMAARINNIAELLRRMVVYDPWPLIDVHAATSERPELFLEDHLHPNTDGYKVIAKTVYAALRDMENAATGGQP